MKQYLLLFLLLTALLLSFSASAEEAPEITDRCTFSQSGKQIKNVRSILDRD